MKPLYSLLILLFCAQVSSAQTTPPYIEAFQALAIQEMDRTGIPASITLAQGIIESAWGKGVLARSSNNHFGIKCKQEWAGQAFHLEDDDYDSEGNLVKSCFRAYEDASSSYLDHSNFLRKGKRYAFLFELDPTDYISWARGLQSAGYATDPEYANKLIKKIEEYQLYQYDYAPEVVAMEVEKSLETTGASSHELSKVGTNLETEIMEAPSYVLPATMTLENEASTVTTNITEISAPQTSKIVESPEVTAPEKKVKTGAEQINIQKKGRMTLHGTFGEL